MHSITLSITDAISPALTVDDLPIDTRPFNLVRYPGFAGCSSTRVDDILFESGRTCFQSIPCGNRLSFACNIEGV